MVELTIIADEPEEEKRKANREDIRKLMLGWRILIQVPDEMAKGWNKVYFPRYAKPLSELLNLFGSWEPAFECMQYVFEHMKKQGLDCTLETVLKRTDLYFEQMGRKK